MEPTQPEENSSASEEDLNAEEDLNKREDLNAEVESDSEDTDLPASDEDSTDDAPTEESLAESESSPPSDGGSGAAGVSKLKVALIAVAGVAAVAGIVSVLDSGSGESAPAPKVGFVLGDFAPGDPVETIRVTLQTSASGQDLEERVDLHLGLGFPLRLFPLGNAAMDPAFAAIPQKSSLIPGYHRVDAGDVGVFEFSLSGDSGLDVLRTTPKLLKDVTVGDISTIGFSSLGSSDWILEGYRIEVNGELFASNDSVKEPAGMILGAARKELAARKPESEVLLAEISTLSSYIATGMGGDKDKSDLAAKEALMEKTSGPLNLLAGQCAGYYPWYTERNEKFSSAVAGPGANSVSEVGVRLIAGGGDQPGTRNPVYIKAGGKKFLLTSEVDPLSNLDKPQNFSISMADLESNPLKRADLDKIGIGIIGNEERFGLVPDRAKLQRVVVTVDGAEVYDSENETGDRRALNALWLVPPVHFDGGGGVVRNEEKETEKYLWVAGMAAPNVPLTEVPEEPASPGTFKPLPIAPSGGPKIPGALPKAPGSPVLLTGAGGPGSLPKTPGTLPKAPGSPPALTGAGGPGALPKTPGTLPKAPGAPPALTGAGGPGTLPKLPGALPKTPGSPPALTGPGGIGNLPAAPGVPPSFNPKSGGRGGHSLGGGNSNSGIRTTFAGPITGSFVPNGQIDLTTGLIRGKFQRNSSGGFTPIRSGNPRGGLHPGIFNQPVIPGKNPNGLSPADIQQIATAILDIIKPIPVKPTPTLPNPPPTLAGVGFPNTASAVEIGRNVVVDWKILGSGNTPNGIASFRVDLMPVLPHLSPPMPSGAKPLASAVALASARKVVIPAIKLSGSGSFPGVAKADLPLLNVQPRVTALDASGKAIGVAEDGPILPLLPDPASYGSQDLKFSLQRGISTKPSDDPRSEVGRSFQMMRDSGATGPIWDSWKKLGFVLPASGITNTAAMLGIKEEGSLAGIRFAPTELGGSPFVFNTAVRTSGGDTAILIFESGIRYPYSGGKPAKAGAAGAIKGYRVVGHLGFLAGAKSGAGRAEVDMRVELGVGPTAPQIVRKKNGDHHLDPALSKTAFFRLESSSPIEVPMVAGGPMQAFDVPISFEFMDNMYSLLSGSTEPKYPVSRPADSFKSVPFGSDSTSLAKHLKVPMHTGNGPSSFSYHKGDTGGFGLTITLMVDTSKAGPDATLGIFGLRIIPDVY